MFHDKSKIKMLILLLQKHKPLLLKLKKKIFISHTRLSHCRIVQILFNTGERCTYTQASFMTFPISPDSQIRNSDVRTELCTLYMVEVPQRKALNYAICPLTQSPPLSFMLNTWISHHFSYSLPSIYNH